ncbi:transmembrane 9 superfamily [Klebsormidium nitens]|uniref:Transmembrane 9 superfamily member n=1 Tax=Klebsormidium nitens TaxID=105231 RepID=A0A1Y1IJF4_KLENI|nr:transmembrane 9 superfamily [Klebsormidium nitens]|eukprot:GAQ91025.1 transmembrane 9 superfamily [Klebsormidium nitens]
MGSHPSSWLVLLLLIAASVCEGADGASVPRRSLLGSQKHHYAYRQDVPLYANKVGPFHNPSVSYQYYYLPFCKPSEGIEQKLEDLGEVLEGDRMTSTEYDLPFRVDKEHEKLCSKTLTVEEVQKFRQAISDDFYFQMFYDDLPIWGFIGKIAKEATGAMSYLLYRHVHFDIHYNKDKVVEINVSTDPLQTVDISDDEPVEVDFSFSAKWYTSETPFKRRMDKYLRYSFLPQHLDIHWFSIVNSCVTVLLLTGFLATILMRVLKNDFTKYAQEEAAAGEQDEVGWKYIHADVFRFPPYPSLFCAIIGAGTQLLALVFCIFMLALVGVFYPYNRGGLYTASILLYALTAGISGYVSAGFYKQMGGTKWAQNLLMAGALFTLPLFLTFCFNNSVAWANQTTAALPFGTIVIILLIWGVITAFTVVGGIAGKNYSSADFDAPCHTSKLPREIPALPWYRHVVPQTIMAGFLPFSAIYIELYYIFASVWGHKIYTIYSILFIVFCILIIVTAFITIGLTYFQLTAEDHGWWWRSLFCGGSAAFFIYAYCFYYYYGHSDMTGFMQTSFYFGYMSIICYGSFLLLGAVGFRAALLFVRHIYKAIKCE